MSHFYERNIIEIKNEYEKFLTNVLTPLLYEGLISIYANAKDYHIDIEEKAKVTPNIQVPSILKIFQIFMKNTPSWNANTISTETSRIKEKSKCSGWFEELIQAVIKSNIVLLTFNVSNKESDIVNQKYHQKIRSEDFIHKCYIE